MIPTKNKCKEHNCVINNKNIIKIYNPEKTTNQKMCDCIIECKNSEIILIEILCGKLTSKEFKDKYTQLQNCDKLANKFLNKSTKKYLVIKTKENSKKDPLLHKLILSKKEIKIKEYKNKAIEIC